MTGRNRLAAETSPYLRQHADNPVDWYPWGDDAFAKAKAEDKPVLLSVGYSACHWCHVMAHESFEDPATAAVMNGRFVNVKVDREERPDVDAVYMTAVQAMTGRGGWPMTVFMTPDGAPFHGGTYYPKADRHGLPGFTRLLHAVDDAWRNRRPELLESAGELSGIVARGGQLPGAPAASALTGATLDRATQILAGSFDARLGGFGGAPKFPQGMAIDFLLRHHLRTGDRPALDMAVQTLDAMAAGGMYDQVGGGFHRYSVDPMWLVPHFEKMLYDQATLTRAYLHAFQVTAAPRYRRIVTETVAYVLRDLGQPGGGFASAEDADSEGEEGRFYVWDLVEFTKVADADAAEAAAFWAVSGGGNFSEDPSHSPEGDNILHIPLPGTGLAGLPGVMDRPAGVERARERLFAHREHRVRPGLDDKVLTGWNAMFGSVLAEAAAAFDRPDWLDAARTNARFLLDALRRPDGRLMRSWQAEANEARHLGYAEDYAALCGFLVTLAEVDDPAWLAPAREVADGLLTLFGSDDGAFFTTGHDAEALIARPKDCFDNATPSANSLAAAALLRLGALTGEVRYRDAGEAALAAVGGLLAEHPTGFAEALGALDRLLAPPLEVAVIGPPGDPATVALAAEVHGRFLRGAVSVVAAPGVGAEHTPLLADRPLVDGKPAAYVCEHFACNAPITDPAVLGATLDSRTAV